MKRLNMASSAAPARESFVAEFARILVFQMYIKHMIFDLVFCGKFLVANWTRVRPQIFMNRGDVLIYLLLARK
jgi:hypothetical protein